MKLDQRSWHSSYERQGQLYSLGWRQCKHTGLVECSWLVDFDHNWKCLVSPETIKGTRFKLERSTSALLTQHRRFMKLRCTRCKRWSTIKRSTEHLLEHLIAQAKVFPSNQQTNMHGIHDSTSKTNSTPQSTPPHLNSRKLRKHQIFRISCSRDWKSGKQSFKTQQHNKPQSNVEIR